MNTLSFSIAIYMVKKRILIMLEGRDNFHSSHQREISLFEGHGCPFSVVIIFLCHQHIYTPIDKGTFYVVGNIVYVDDK